MSYSRSLGADAPIVRSHLTPDATAAAPLTTADGGSTVTRVLLVGAVVGGGFLLWRKLRKKRKT
jgi:hypothetical protein